METLEDIIEQLSNCIQGIMGSAKHEWEITENDGLRNKVRYRYEAAHRLQTEIRDEVGEVIDLCADLIEGNSTMRLDYCLNDSGFRKELQQCIAIMHFYPLDMYVFEEKRKIDRKHGIISSCSLLPKSKRSYSVPEDKIELFSGRKYHDALDEQYNLYYRHCNTFEFKLCWHICSHYYETSEPHIIIPKKMETYALAVCLYIALKNEKAVYKKDAINYDVRLPGEQKIAKKRVKKKREVFTERANDCFRKAIEKGYMKEVADDGNKKYEWVYYGGKVALIYFLMRTYEPDSPPYRQLEPLLGTSGLSSSKQNLVSSHWYEDEKKRQEMTPEKLKMENRMKNLKKPPEWFLELKDFFE